MVKFPNLSKFFNLRLTINESWYFFKIGHKDGVGQLRSPGHKGFWLFYKGDHEWAMDTLEVSDESKSESWLKLCFW